MSVLRELRILLRLRVLQLFFLSSLLVLLAAIAFVSQTTVRDPDIWWHLKVGDWIVQHRAVPFVGIFSRTAETRPWIAYSWGYEVLLSRAYAWFGLLGFASFGIVLTVAVGFVLFWMLHRLSGRFWVAWLLTLAGSFAYLFSLMPRPVFVTMILFTIVLTLMLQAQRAGNVRFLYWLPLVFVIWANVHIQFIYGLAALGLFSGINWLQRLARRAGLELESLEAPTLHAVHLAGILASCIAVCFVGPYSYHLIQVVRTYSNSHVPYYMIQELAAFEFNSFTHYLVLLLCAGAFYVVGLNKKLSVFKLSMLIVASLVAFRTQRDAWFASICAVAFIADFARNEEAEMPALRFPELLGVGAGVVAIVVLVAANIGFNTRNLDRAISSEYPVSAANFLRQNPAPGPLYNALDWGGFLIWYLPQYPVAVDGRNDLYGDEIDSCTYKSSVGEAYKSDPYLNESRVVLLSRKLPLADLLTIDSNFRMVYRDQVAVIYVRQ